MKKTIIGLLAMILAAISASFLGDQNINIEEKKIEGVLVELGEHLFDTNNLNQETLDNTSDIEINDLPWSKGEFDNPYQNITHHYNKHGEDVGVTSVQDYYDLANEIIDNTSSAELVDLYCDGCVDYFDDERDFIVGLSPGGSINTLHQVTSKAKLERIQEHDNLR